MVWISISVNIKQTISIAWFTCVSTLASFDHYLLLVKRNSPWPVISNFCVHSTQTITFVYLQGDDNALYLRKKRYLYEGYFTVTNIFSLSHFHRNQLSFISESSCLILSKPSSYNNLHKIYQNVVSLNAALAL